MKLELEKWLTDALGMSFHSVRWCYIRCDRPVPIDRGTKLRGPMSNLIEILDGCATVSRIHRCGVIAVGLTEGASSGRFRPEAKVAATLVGGRDNFSRHVGVRLALERLSMGTLHSGTINITPETCPSVLGILELLGFRPRLSKLGYLWSDFCFASMVKDVLGRDSFKQPPSGILEIDPLKLGIRMLQSHARNELINGVPAAFKKASALAQIIAPMIAKMAVDIAGPCGDHSGGKEKKTVDNAEKPPSEN